MNPLHAKHITSAILQILLILLSLCFYTAASAQSDAKAWSRVDKPTTSRNAQSIGKYTSGCLMGAATLPINGTGYQVMRLSRKRFYGHPDLIHFIEKLGEHAHSQKLGTLLIGDLGMARGGPTLSGHKSHQSGLDVDIWYLLSPEAEKRELSLSERESWSAPSVLKASTKGINYGEWSTANEKILAAAARMPEVDRIFVNAHIKKELCSRKDSDWLQKIRPWHKHDDHFHVRLKCPVGNLSCDKQDPVPAGDGCGADLAWWFQDHSKDPKTPPPPKVPLPKECDAVLYE